MQVCFFFNQLASHSSAIDTAFSIAVHMPPILRQSHIEEFRPRNARSAAGPRASASAALQQPVFEISSDSGDLGDRSTAAAIASFAPLPSTEGLQGATAISEWTWLWWQCLTSSERKATQAACYFIRSDVRWYCKAMPMWSTAQQRLLDPEQSESEHGAAFDDDISLPDSESGAVYHALPRKAG